MGEETDQHVRGRGSDAEQKPDRVGRVKRRRLGAFLTGQTRVRPGLSVSVSGAGRMDLGSGRWSQVRHVGWIRQWTGLSIWAPILGLFFSFYFILIKLIHFN